MYLHIKFITFLIKLLELVWFKSTFRYRVDAKEIILPHEFILNQNLGWTLSKLQSPICVKICRDDLDWQNYLYLLSFKCVHES